MCRTGVVDSVGGPGRVPSAGRAWRRATTRSPRCLWMVTHRSDGSLNTVDDRMAARVIGSWLVAGSIGVWACLTPSAVDAYCRAGVNTKPLGACAEERGIPRLR